ncbi:MAG: hypothetical protein AAF639_01290 [Chloroflexota bacterium]
MQRAIHNQTRTFNTLLFFSFFAIVIGIFCSIFVQEIGAPDVVWDDAYMFVRYAHNFLHEGQISWNPQGPATFGLTSMLYWAVMVVPIHTLTESTRVTAIMASFLSGCLFLLLTIWMIMRHTAAGPMGKRLMVLLMLVLITYPREAISEHFLTGMDTMFALAGVTAYILLAKWHEQSPSLASVCLVGIAGAMLASIRPELLLYAVMVPSICFLFAQDARSRWTAIGVGTVTIAVLLLMVGAAARYLNSPLPLPFYAKGLKLYGDAFYAVYAFDSFVYAKEFVVYYNGLLALILLGVLYHPKRWWQGLTPADRGILGAAILFSLYFLLLVTPIMGMFSRFYYPLLPVILFLAVRTYSIFADKLAGLKNDIHSYLSHQATLPALLLVLIIIFTPYLYQVRYLVKMPRYPLDVYAFYLSDSRVRHLWFELNQFSRLPDEVTMATTEIGLVGVMNPDKVVIDLAGLNEREIAHNGFSAQWLLQTHQPDLIYLPFPHYQTMIGELLNNPQFQAEYTYFSAQQLHRAMGIALSIDSPYYAEMLDIVQSQYAGDPVSLRTE